MSLAIAQSLGQVALLPVNPVLSLILALALLGLALNCSRGVEGDACLTT